MSKITGAPQVQPGRKRGQPTAALRASGVSKRYGATQALDGADLTVFAGEVHGLVGANGAGKSTLVNILSGAVQADSGEIGIGDWRGPGIHPRQAQRLGVATIYQDGSIVPTLGLAENILLGREARSGPLLVSRTRERAEVEEVLARVGLKPDHHRTAESLKPAELQLLEIAKALYRGARVLIMDEPTAALGPRDSARLFDLIAALRSEGVSVVYISHRLEDVIAVCDRISVFRDGKRVKATDAAGVDEDALVRLMVGHAVDRRRARSGTPGEVVLEVSSLGQRDQLRDINLAVREGEVVGLTGVVGCGRSRLARVLFGAERPDRGEMRLRGEIYAPSSPTAAIAAGVAYAPENRKRDALLMTQGADRNITLARLPTFALGLVDLSAERRAATQLMDRLGVVPPVGRLPAASFSGGNQQKLSIARWLHAGSRLLILDEPGQGIDIAAKDRILEEMARLAREGLSILMISSELEELVQVVDRLLVMRRGTIAGELGRDQLTEHRVLELALGSGGVRNAT